MEELAEEDSLRLVIESANRNVQNRKALIPPAERAKAEADHHVQSQRQVADEAKRLLQKAKDSMKTWKSAVKLMRKDVCGITA